MRTFQLHILAADRVFFEGECESVVVPTASGQYGVQAHHSNMIAAIVARRAHLPHCPGRNALRRGFGGNDQGGA